MMSQRRVVPIHLLAASSPPPPLDTDHLSLGAAVVDRLGRPLTDLRVSVTDRCNFRCGYCMPKQVFGLDHAFQPHTKILSFEEISQLARVFVGLGVRKIRLTGGEPLLRRNLETLIAQLATLRTPDGEALDLTLTTNGSALAAKARTLKAAGLQRLTVSLDGLDDNVFRRMNDVDFPVQRVLDGIAAAQAEGLAPVKVNMVVQRGVNDGEALAMARHFRGSGVVLRFIEYMDVGNSNGWRMDQVVPSAELRRRIAEHFPLQPLEPNSAGETAERWAYTDGAGEVGFVSSVTQAFCSDCSRARLSTDGHLYACLFASQGHDVRRWLRSETPLDDEQIASGIANWWNGRDAAYSEQRLLQPHAPATLISAAPPRVEMSFIGG